MNFIQLIEETKKSLLEKKSTSTFFLGMAVEEIVTQTNKVYVPGWENDDFDKSKVSNFYINFRACLQFIGMELMDGNEERDKTIFEDLTEVLAALREVIIRNFQIELPEARAVSMVTEAVEDGLLEEFRDEDGILRIKTNENYCNLKIKIIKTPVGPAPEEFRQKWLKVPKLPARKCRPGEARNYGYPEEYEEGYWVPKEEGIKSLKEISSEAADWFVENFDEFSPFIFHLDEAEIVS